MNLIILKGNLKDGLSIISGARKDTSNLPILRNFLLAVDGGRLKMVSTDLEIAISYNLSAKIIEDGSVAIPYNTFFQIISNLSFERVNLESKGNNLLVTTDSYKAKISTLPKDDYPIIPEIKNIKENHFLFDCHELVESLSGVVSACQMSDLRPELNGLLFSFKDGVVKIVATDSFRLAEKTIGDKNFETKLNEDVNFIIPLKTIHEVIRIFSLNKEEKIKIYFDQNQISFETENIKLISRLIEGKFPDYDSIIPKTFETEILLLKEDLISGLKLTGSLSNKLNEVKIITSDDLKNIKMFSSNHEVGESEYILPAKIKGNKIGIIFNWRFIMDSLKNIKTESVSIGFNGEDRPSLIKSPEDKSFVYILMPIKSS